VQDPGDAAFSGMPTRALQMVRPDHVAPLRELPVLLDALARQPEGAPVEPPPGLRLEVDMALGRSAGTEELGERSVQTCPICHGSMWNVEDGELIRFRCHVGHAFSAEAMQSSLSDSLRDALSIALRSVQERAHLLANMERRSRQHGHERLATQWAERLQECRREMEVVRSAMERVYRAEKNLPAEEFQGEPNPS
jgi:two-component system chemotaxis response regulator CheB